LRDIFDVGCGGKGEVSGFLEDHLKDDVPEIKSYNDLIKL
jgi:hypothetical protein